MKIKLTVIIFTILIPVFGFGQIDEEIKIIDRDSLARILPDLFGEEHIDAMNRIAFSIARDLPDSCLAMSEHSLLLSNSLNYSKGKADALLNHGIIGLWNDSIKQSVNYLLGALRIYEGIDPCKEMGFTLKQLQMLNVAVGRWDNSIAYGKKAAYIFKLLSMNKYEVRPILHIAIAYAQLNKSDSSEYYLNKALAILDQHPDPRSRARTFIDLGYCYGSRSNLDNIWCQEAASYYEKAFRLSESIHDTEMMVLSLIPSGVWNIQIGTDQSIQKGLDYLHQGIKLNRDEKLKGFMLIAYSSIARVEFRKGNFSRAAMIVKQGFQEEEKISESPKTDYLDPASKILDSYSYRSAVYRGYRLLYIINLDIGNHEEALEYLKLAEKAKDEIFLDENKNLVTLLEAESENEKTKKQIALLENERELNALKVSQSRYYIYGLATIMLIVILSGLFFFRLRKYRSDQKAIIREKQLQYDLELKELESKKLKELDKLKSRFFTNISHEFRTPLTLILGPLNELKKVIDDSRADKDLQIIHRNAKRLQNLIDQILDLSKFESGKMKLQASETDIVQISRTFFQSFESLARQKDISLVFDASDQYHQVYIDHDKYEKILFNLISNALKFTDKDGEVKLSISQSDDHILILFSDTGRGIPTDKIDHVFDRFWQGDDDNNNSQGTGIGLALVKELVELHHGVINLVSEPGKGTTFTIRLLIGRDHFKDYEIDDKKEFQIPAISEDHVLISKNHTPESEDNNGFPILLIVEDNDDMRYHLRSQMVDEYSIIEAAEGKEGLKKAIDSIPDLIISDVMMPEMDGIELCRNLKTDERTSHIPVILLTAKAAMEDRLEGLETGADDFLTKPFDQQELKVRVSNLIQQRNNLQEKFKKNAVQLGLTKVLNLPESGISSTDQKFLRKAVEVVLKNIDNEDFTAEVFRDEIAMSNTQLFRKLKSLVGQSASGFIRSVRLNRAEELLKERSGNITEIAYEVGFNNLSYFSKCFEEQFGETPSKYRSNIRD